MDAVVHACCLIPGDRRAPEFHASLPRIKKVNKQTKCPNKKPPTTTIKQQANQNIHIKWQKLIICEFKMLFRERFTSLSSFSPFLWQFTLGGGVKLQHSCIPASALYPFHLIYDIKKTTSFSLFGVLPIVELVIVLYPDS